MRFVFKTSYVQDLGLFRDGVQRNWYIALLIGAFVLPRLEPREHTPHKPLHNASLYWHFVDVVWVFIVGLLYVLPHLKA